MVHTAMLVLLDSVAMVIAFEAGRLIRGALGRPFANVMDEDRFAAVVLATIPLWVLIFGICGLYRVQVNGGRVSEVGRVIVAVTGGVMLLTSVAYLSYGEAIFPSRSVPLFAMLIGIPLVVFGRQVVRVVMRNLFSRGRALRNVVLVGTGPMAARIATEFRKRTSGYRILGVVGCPIRAGEALGDIKIYPTLESTIADHPDARIDEIVQADLDITADEASSLMAYANAEGMNYRFVPDKYGVYAAASKMATIDGIPVMEVRLTALDGWGQSASASSTSSAPLPFWSCCAPDAPDRLVDQADRARRSGPLHPAADRPRREADRRHEVGLPSNRIQ